MSRNKLIYLDCAAATPMDPRVIEAMTPYFNRAFYNPSAIYSEAEAVKEQLTEARRRVALVLGAKPAEIVFTAGGTEANNLAITGVMKNYPAANLVISALEHDSINQPAADWNHQTTPVRSDGRLDLTQLAKTIDDQTVLVSIIYASNEIGTIEPIAQVARLIQKIRGRRLEAGNQLPIYLHSDGCQAANYLDLHVSRLGVDLLTLNGGKIYGPKQSGVLYVRAGVKLAPLIKGGGQERGLRSGTENVPSAVGFAKALELVQAERSAESDRLAKLQTKFIALLRQSIPEVVVNGSLEQRLVNNVHITLPGADNERLILELDNLGILGAAGSACSAASAKPSTVLAAIGLTDQQARSSLRLSLGQMTTESDVKAAARALSSLVKG